MDLMPWHFYLLRSVGFYVRMTTGRIGYG